jgi:uncharacterized protein YfaS (alpha-2-macroglobulin family)
VSDPIEQDLCDRCEEGESKMYVPVLYQVCCRLRVLFRLHRRVQALNVGSFARISAKTYVPVMGLVALLVMASLAVVSPGCHDDDVSLADLSTLGPNEVAVSAVHPSTQQLTPTSSLGVSFSRPLAPAGTRPGSYIEDPALSLTPEIPGVWKWTSDSRLEFFPDGSYLPNTSYLLEIELQITAGTPHSLRGKRTFVFLADPFELVRGRLQRETVSAPEQSFRVVGSFRFNHPVEPQVFAEHVSAHLEELGAIDLTVDTREPSEVISFKTKPITAQDESRDLTVTVEAGLLPVQGDEGLREDVTKKIELPPRGCLTVDGIALETEGARHRAHIRLSDRVDEDALRRALVVTPQVSSLRVSCRGSDVYLDASWVSGTRYEVEIAKGLTAENGHTLEHDFVGSVSLGNLPPSLTIVGRGNYLSLRGEQRIAVETVNIDKITVELDRIHANNLVPFLQGYSLRRLDSYWWLNLDRYGDHVYRRDVQIEGEPNEKTLTAISLADELTEDSRGIFRLRVRKGDERRLRETRGIVATDLGLVAKRAGRNLYVAVVSIADLMPLAGIEVAVLSYNNQTVAEGRTDGQGRLSFTALDWESQAKKPFVIVATRGDDLGFLAFDDTRIWTSDLDVGGVEHTTRGYDAFLYTDRGIYRPGDTTRVAWIVRDAAQQAPPIFPLTLRVTGPDRKVFNESRVSFGATGTGEYTLTIPDYARTGGYQLALHLDERTVIGSASIQVEDFMPDRMKAELDLVVERDAEGSESTAQPAQDKARVIVRPGQKVEARLRAMTLFGPAAADRKTTARVRFRPERIAFDQWKGYTFGDRAPADPIPEKELGERQTDAEGHASWMVDLPRVDDYHGWLRATVEAEVEELGGGRAVHARASLTVSPVTHVIGLRRGNEDGSDYYEPGESIPFRAVLLDLEGNPVAAENATLRILRRHWRTIIRQDEHGYYRYVSEYDEVEAGEQTVSLVAGENDLQVTVERHGSYRLVLETSEPGARSSIDFYAYGWGYSPWAMSQPERVSIKLDRESYLPGEMLSAEIEAPFSGLLLLSIERERVFHQEWVELRENSAAINIRVPEDTKPNAYLVATLLRPLDSLEPHAPARAFGAVPIFIDRKPATLTIELRGPEVTRPREELRIDFRLPDLAADDAATVTIAAVDEGILQITGFDTPDPLEHFFRRRRLSVASYEVWSLLMPEYEQVVRTSATGGGSSDEAAETLRKNLNPIAVRRVKPVALWSGVLDGSASWQTITFDVPEFTGALRLMAVASSRERFGSEEQLVRVRDPIVLSPNLPRFLAPGDEFLIPVQVYNGVTEKTGEVIPIRVTLDVTGPMEIATGGEGASDGGTAQASGATVTQEIRIAGGTEEVVYFRARARDGVGKATFTFTGEHGETRTITTTEMAVRPPQPLDGIARTGVVRDGEQAEVVLSNRWYASTGRVTVTVSRLPVAQFAASLPYVLRYPYGCIEQTTSSCFPLLYFAELAAELAPDLFGSRDADYYIHAGIDRILNMQLRGGGFSYWSGGSQNEANPWASCYATHFLVEAARKGYVVPEAARRKALERLAELARSSERGWHRSWSDFERRSTRAYALYVLAVAGEPERGAMDYLVQNELQRMNAASRTHLAGAFGLIGHREMMDEILPAQLTPEVDEERLYGYSWRSPARDEAVQLDVLATVDPHHEHVPVLLQRLAARAENGRWHNTQENGFALLALGKLVTSGTTDPAPGEVLLDGEVIGRFAEEGVTLRGRDWYGRQVTIRTVGDGFAYYSILDEGIPRAGEERTTDAGLTVSRQYLNRNGLPVDLAQIEQGDIVVCRLRLTSEKGTVENVVVADLIPAGLEIENPRLVNRSGLEWIRERPADAPPREDNEETNARDRRRGRSRRPPARSAGSGRDFLSVDYLDVRDDRLLLFTTARSRTQEFLYGLRAVTAGAFVLPPVKAEAMYDPDVRSIRGGGKVTVVQP